MIKTKNLRLFLLLYTRARIILMIVAFKRKGEKGGRGSCVVGSCGILENVITWRGFFNLFKKLPNSSRKLSWVTQKSNVERERRGRITWVLCSQRIPSFQVPGSAQVKLEKVVQDPHKTAAVSKIIIKDDFIVEL